MAAPLFPAVDAHGIDTNRFIEFERADAVSLLERAVTDHGVVLLCPSRVCDELTPETVPYEVPLVDTAIEHAAQFVLYEEQITDTELVRLLYHRRQTEKAQ